MAFRRNFVRKEFSDYLGEERAILDIFVSNEEVILPSPTPTPTSTVTPTPTPTITLTPSVTPTNTPTTTITPTPSITPTISVTPSITPTITPTNTITPTPTITPSPSPFPTYSFSGAVYDASSYSGACSSSTVVNNLWGLNPVWSGNTALFTDSIATIPAPAGFYNYNDIVLEVITGGNVPNPPYVCPPSFDADAAAYLADVLSAGGTGITATISAATDTLFTDLKSNGLYSKLDVLYLMLGETSGSTALNAIRTNSSFDITWNNVGSLTFNYSGVTGGGTGYGNTNYNPRLEAAANNTSWGIYQTAGNFNGEVYSFGAFDGTYINNHRNDGGNQIGLFGFDVNTSRTNLIIPGSKSGSYIGTFTGATKAFHFNYSTLSQSNSSAAGGAALLSNQPYYLFTLNLQGAPYSGNYFNGRIQSWFVGDYLTTAEVNTIDGLINTFHTTLGRNTY